LRDKLGFPLLLQRPRPQADVCRSGVMALATARRSAASSPSVELTNTRSH